LAGKSFANNAANKRQCAFELLLRSAQDSLIAA